jgi:hypothetical protein
MRFLSLDIEEFMQEHPETTGEKVNFYYFELPRQKGVLNSHLSFMRILYSSGLMLMVETDYKDCKGEEVVRSWQLAGDVITETADGHMFHKILILTFFSTKDSSKEYSMVNASLCQTGPVSRYV